MFFANISGFSLCRSSLFSQARGWGRSQAAGDRSWQAARLLSLGEKVKSEPKDQRRRKRLFLSHKNASRLCRLHQYPPPPAVHRHTDMPSLNGALSAPNTPWLQSSPCHPQLPSCWVLLKHKAVRRDKDSAEWQDICPYGGTLSIFTDVFHTINVGKATLEM